MWRDPRNKRNDFFQIYCFNCNAVCENSYFEMPSLPSTRKCEICNNVRRFLKCNQTICGCFVRICPDCYAESSTYKKSKKNKELQFGFNTSVKKSISDIYMISVFVMGIFMIIASWFYYTKSAGNFKNENLIILENLRKNYPSQKNETFYHFLSVLDKEIPSVKSITFLHGKYKGTSDCLAKELVLLYTKNKNIKSEDITFSNFEAEDYGFVLKHYHKIVQKFGVFIADLNKVSGKVARIFHSLCDEVSSDIKPSLFIFTLIYDGRTETLKPVERATHILRKNWSDLPENELFPLLSRVIKNVVDIVPEHQINC